MLKDCDDEEGLYLVKPVKKKTVIRCVAFLADYFYRTISGW